MTKRQRENMKAYIKFWEYLVEGKGKAKEVAPAVARMTREEVDQARKDAVVYQAQKTAGFVGLTA